MPEHDREARPAAVARAKRGLKRRVTVDLPIGSCKPLAFNGSRSRNRFGRINLRSFLTSPLIVVGKSLKLTRNRSVGHGLGSAEQGLCCF
jgi:hypothetical protein